jgi:hypothetical protein
MTGGELQLLQWLLGLWLWLEFLLAYGMVGLSSCLWFGLFAWYDIFGERYTTLVGYWF